MKQDWNIYLFSPLAPLKMKIIIDIDATVRYYLKVCNKIKENFQSSLSKIMINCHSTLEKTIIDVDLSIIMETLLRKFNKMFYYKEQESEKWHTRRRRRRKSWAIPMSYCSASLRSAISIRVHREGRGVYPPLTKFLLPPPPPPDNFCPGLYSLCFFFNPPPSCRPDPSHVWQEDYT